MTTFYPNLCYNEVCYERTALYEQRRGYNPYPLRGPNDHDIFHSNTADTVNVLKYFEHSFFLFLFSNIMFVFKFQV